MVGSRLARRTPRALMEKILSQTSTLDPRGPEDGKKLSPSEAQVAEYNRVNAARTFEKDQFSATVHSEMVSLNDAGY